MKKILYIILLPALFIIVASIYCINYRLSLTASFKEALTAEIVGSGVLGLYILGITLVINGVLDKSSKKVEEREVLLNIVEEIDWNLARNNESKGSRLDLAERDHFKDTFWNAAASSNLISRINSSELMNRISSAYFALKIVIDMEDQAKKHLSSYPSDRALADAMLPDIARYRIRMSENLIIAKKRCNDRIKELS